MRRLVRDAYARSGKLTVVRVLDSGSMRPLMAGERDLLVRWGVPRSHKIVGAILLFEVEGGIVFVHRAAACRRTVDGALEILHVADTYPRGDPYSAYWASEGDVLGEVVAISEPGASTRIDVTTPLARAVGRVVAVAGWVAWRTDRARSRVILGPPAFAMHRLTTRIAASTVLRCSRGGA